MVRASDRRKRDSFPEVRGWNQMMGADISRLQASEDDINKRDKMRHYGLILIRSLPIHGYRKWWQRLLPPAATKWNRADMVFSFSPVCRCTSCGNLQWSEGIGPSAVGEKPVNISKESIESRIQSVQGKDAMMKEDESAREAKMPSRKSIKSLSPYKKSLSAEYIWIEEDGREEIQ